MFLLSGIACFATPCLNRGTCGQSTVTGEYVCLCEDGYTGDHCETGAQSRTYGTTHTGITSYSDLHVPACSPEIN